MAIGKSQGVVLATGGQSVHLVFWELALQNDPSVG